MECISNVVICHRHRIAKAYHQPSNTNIPKKTFSMIGAMTRICKGLCPEESEKKSKTWNRKIQGMGEKKKGPTDSSSPRWLFSILLSPVLSIFVLAGLNKVCFRFPQQNSSIQLGRRDSFPHTIHAISSIKICVGLKDQYMITCACWRWECLFCTNFAGRVGGLRKK